MCSKHRVIDGRAKHVFSTIRHNNVMGAQIYEEEVTIAIPKG
jgi:hypothetical protein